MNRFWLFSGLLASAMLAAPAATLADGGIKLPNLNPFAKSKRPPAQPAHPRPERKAFVPTLPKLPLTSRPPGQPSMWQKLNRGTKTFFNKAVTVLTFGKIRPGQTPQTKVTGTQRIYPGGPRTARRPSHEPDGGLLPWFRPPEKPHKRDSIQDWLRQPRVPLD